jgi:hypothetical protein
VEPTAAPSTPADAGAARMDGARIPVVVPPAGLEPAPRGLKGRRSNQLSYRGEAPIVDGGAPNATTGQERSGMPW